MKRGSGFIAEQVKSPASHTRLLVEVLIAPFLTQLPAEAPAKPEDGPSGWVSVTHVGDLDGAPDLQLWSGLALALVAIQGVNQQSEDVSITLSFSLFLCLSDRRITLQWRNPADTTVTKLLSSLPCQVINLNSSKLRNSMQDSQLFRNVNK